MATCVLVGAHLKLLSCDLAGYVNIIIECKQNFIADFQDTISSFVVDWLYQDLIYNKSLRYKESIDETAYLLVCFGTLSVSQYENTKSPINNVLVVL